MNYEDGIVYSKYKKIKDQSGVERATKYVTNDEKTKPILTGSGELEEHEETDVKRAMEYIQNDVKTFNSDNYQHLVSGINCIPNIAAEQFRQDEEDYRAVKKEHLLAGQSANKAFHIILSYKGTDIVSPELCHKLGVEFAQRIAGDEFRAVVATHLNTQNVHNHIIICAYSMDKEHPHKYLDGFNQYKFFRKVANELSVEYGLPIFLDDKKTKCPSWGEMMKSEEGNSWINQLKQDISDLMDASNTFDEVLKGMKELGYEVTINKTSVTYQKGIYKARDRRLGRDYTEEGFNETMKKLDEIKTNYSEKIKVDETKFDYSPIYISRYDEVGRRRGSLIRLLLLIKKLIEKFGDSFLVALEGNNNDRPEMKHKEIKLQLIDETINTLNKYHIGSEEALDLTLRALHQNRKELLIQLTEMKDIVDNGEHLRADIDRFMELYDVVKAIGINPEDLVPDYEETRVNENKASLNPMRPATKSRLYRAMHGSPYILSKTFREMTEKEAREVIKAVSEERTDNLPDILMLRNQRRERPKKKKRERTAYDLSKLSEDKKNEVLELKELLNTLGLYGIDNKIAARNFKNEYDKSLIEIEKINKKLSSFDGSIRELYKTKKLCEKMQTSDFAYGVLFTGNREMLEEGAAEIGKEATNLDYLKVIKKQLDHLDPNAFLENNSTLPDPSQYRILKDLEYIYPGILSDIKIDDPREVDEIITAISLSGWIDDEIEREERREQGLENSSGERPNLRHLVDQIYQDEDPKKKRR